MVRFSRPFFLGWEFALEICEQDCGHHYEQGTHWLPRETVLSLVKVSVRAISNNVEERVTSSVTVIVLESENGNGNDVVNGIDHVQDFFCVEEQRPSCPIPHPNLF